MHDPGMSAVNCRICTSYGCLTPQNAESQYWLIFLRKFKFCVMRIFVYSVIMDLCIYM